MPTSGTKLVEIKKDLALLPENKLDEVRDFIGFILSKHHKKIKKNIRLKGIWKDRGFEQLDLMKELKAVRQEMAASILKKGE